MRHVSGLLVPGFGCIVLLRRFMIPRSRIVAVYMRDGCEANQNFSGWENAGFLAFVVRNITFMRFIFTATLT